MRTQLATLFLVLLIALMSGVVGIWGYGIYAKKQAHQQILYHQHLSSVLLLTDFCLTTESRHTRHYAQPEIIAPFQDFPAYWEHFPSSSFFPAPHLQPSSQ